MYTMIEFYLTAILFFFFFTLLGSLAVASHLELAGFLRGTHSPPWSKDTTDCTELSENNNYRQFKDKPEAVTGGRIKTNTKL